MRGSCSEMLSLKKNKIKKKENWKKTRKKKKKKLLKAVNNGFWYISISEDAVPKRQLTLCSTAPHSHRKH